MDKYYNAITHRIWIQAYSTQCKRLALRASRIETQLLTIGHSSPDVQVFVLYQTNKYALKS